MRSTFAFAAIALGLTAACGSPPAQTAPDNVVNGTMTDQAFPSQATGNDIVTGDDGAGNSAGNPTVEQGNAAGQQGQQQQAPAQ